MDLLWGCGVNRVFEVEVGSGIGQVFSVPRSRETGLQNKERVECEVAVGLGAGTGLAAALGFTVHWASTTVPELL